MNISTHDLEAELDAFGAHRVEIVTEIAHEGAGDGIGPALLLALGSRETNLRNIAGDMGHGRGWVQIDDRFHGPWLDAHAGCDSGSWDAKYRSALPAGHVPTLTASTLKAIEMLQANMAFGRAKGIPDGQAVRFACAAYNAGPGGAIAGAHAGDVDSGTTGHDYSADVLARKEAITRWLRRHGLST
jgi:hypothetical protein